MIDCETAVRRLWDFVDGRLPVGARLEVEAHLGSCPDCPPHFAFAREMRSAVAATKARVGPDETQLRARVRAALAARRRPT
jgi:anti-sigma factor RsiW